MGCRGVLRPGGSRLDTAKHAATQAHGGGWDPRIPVVNADARRLTMAGWRFCANNPKTAAMCADRCPALVIILPRSIAGLRPMVLFQFSTFRSQMKRIAPPLLDRQTHVAQLKIGLQTLRRNHTDPGSADKRLRFSPTGELHLGPFMEASEKLNEN